MLLKIEKITYYAPECETVKFNGEISYIKADIYIERGNQWEVVTSTSEVQNGKVIDNANAWKWTDALERAGWTDDERITYRNYVIDAQQNYLYKKWSKHNATLNEGIKVNWTFETL